MRHAAVLALLGWVALGFGHAALEAAGGWRQRDSHIAAPNFWRFGTPKPSRLARCLARAAEVIPPGSSLTVTTPHPDLHFWRWAAYLLPARDVVPGPGSGVEPVAAEYLVGFGPHTPAGQRLRGGRWCAVYRLP